MAWPVRPEFLTLYHWEDLVFILILSKGQTFCVPFNNDCSDRGLAVLMESALRLSVKIHLL